MIFLTGMFRSGTTFLARLLNQTPDVAFASDPFLPVLKDFRNAVARLSGVVLEPAAPLGDYYFERSQNDFFRQLQDTGFSDIAIPDLSALAADTASFSKPFSPLLSPRIGEIKARTFGDFFSRGIELIQQVYGPKNFAGFKEVWSTEFTPHFLHLFGPETRVIQLVRDPRSVLVSNFYSEGRYPILFLARQWRKLAALAYAYELSSDNVRTVRYEDLIAQPEETFADICNFVGIDYDSAYLDTTTLKDGGNKQWLQNSTFGEQRNPGFNRSSLDKWRSRIEPETQRAIEFLTYPELSLLGYSAELFSPGDDVSRVQLTDDSSKLADWIRPYSLFDEPRERNRESDRLQGLWQAEDSSCARRHYLLPEVYQACRHLPGVR